MKVNWSIDPRSMIYHKGHEEHKGWRGRNNGICTRLVSFVTFVVNSFIHPVGLFVAF